MHFFFFFGKKMMKMKADVKSLTRMSSRQQAESKDPHGPQVLLATRT